MNSALTLREVEDRLRTMLVEDSVEGVHEEADDLLLDALELAGMGHIVRLYSALKSQVFFRYGKVKPSIGHAK